MISNKKFNSTATELFIWGRKINISVVFIMQSCFKLPQEARLSTIHSFIMKIANKRELQQTAINHSSDIAFKDFMKIYTKCTAGKYSFLVNDMTYYYNDLIYDHQIIC